MEKRPRCVLTGYADKSLKFIETINPLVIEYTFSPVGRVRISRQKYDEFIATNDLTHYKLAGICRNAFENGEDPPLINTEFIGTGIVKLTIPEQFKEKAHHLLRYLYFHGGKDYKIFDLHSLIDYPLCYCESDDEFDRVVTYLNDKGFIIYKEKDTSFGLGYGRYADLRLTLEGIQEIEKELPDVPLVGLVNQKISTGDEKIDESINHAMYLFFNEPRSMDRMRSACESLSYVLEPLRKDLINFFGIKDVSDFFQIVNTFDIRHNKEHTKQIKLDEQLEWVFYSLLNTINTYVKLKKRPNLD